MAAFQSSSHIIYFFFFSVWFPCEGKIMSGQTAILFFFQTSFYRWNFGNGLARHTYCFVQSTKFGRWPSGQWTLGAINPQPTVCKRSEYWVSRKIILNICDILQFQINYTAWNWTLAKNVKPLHSYVGNMMLHCVFVIQFLRLGKCLHYALLVDSKLLP